MSRLNNPRGFEKWLPLLNVCLSDNLVVSEASKMFIETQKTIAKSDNFIFWRKNKPILKGREIYFKYFGF